MSTNTLDVSSFVGACQFVIAATGKEAAPLVNKYLLQAIIGSKGIEGAMQRTPKADSGKLAALGAGAKTTTQGAKIYKNQYGSFSARASRKITAEASIVRGYIAAKLRRSGKLKTTSGPEFDALVIKELKRRIAAVGYTAYIGWTPAAEAFGGTGAVGGGKTKLDESQFQISQARHGGGSKATVGHLVAEAINTAPQIEDIGVQPLQDSLDAEVPDTENYGNLKLQGVFNKVAGKYV